MKLMQSAFPWHLVAPLYQERHRSYHGVQHVHYILRQIDALPISVDEKDFLSAIAWLHDAHHDPLAGSPSNERRSAELLDIPTFATAFTEDGLSLARQTIMATADHLNDQVMTQMMIDDGQEMIGLFLDLDLAHLGDTQETFLRTSRSVSEEYRRAGTSYEDLIKGHPAFAQKMLARKKLFYTKHFEGRETQARANLLLAASNPHLMIGNGLGETEFVQTKWNG